MVVIVNFKPRLTKPEAGNKYYNTKSVGGYSDAIKGSPTDFECNVLANCVGYAYGRFNEIGNYGYCKYLRPVNAENFMQVAKDQGLPTGSTPKLGACMVWQKGATLSNGDGAGHVAIVEQIISDTEIVTSESGWNDSRYFWTRNRKKSSDGNWSASAGYKFLGFIYNPAVPDNEEPASTTASASSNTTQNIVETPADTTIAFGQETDPKCEKGDIVEFMGEKQYRSSDGVSPYPCKPGKAKVTNTAPNARHPYHLIAVNGGGSTVYGWVNAEDINRTKEIESSTPVVTPTTVVTPTPVVTSPVISNKKFEKGDIVNFKGNFHYTNSVQGTMFNCLPGKAKVTNVAKNGKHKYHLIAVAGGGSTVYGWVNESDVEAI